MNKSTAAYIINNSKPTIPDPNKWDTPGGGAEENESFEDCLLRELAEELELKLDKSRIKYLWELKTAKNNIEQSFLINLSNNEVKSLVLHEGQQMRFFTLNEFLNLAVTKHLTNVFKVKHVKLKEIFS